MSYTSTKTIAVDVDGTLIDNGYINIKLIEWCKLKKQNGYSLILWSARGKKHAMDAAIKTDTINLFDVIISKPSCIVDDLGWRWIKHTVVVPPNNLPE